MGRSRGGKKSNQEPGRPGSERQADAAADCGEHHALDQQLADNAHPARTERKAYRHFLLPGGGASDQQAGNVRARDQQHAADNVEEQLQRRFELLPDPRVALRR